MPAFRPIAGAIPPAAGAAEALMNVEKRTRICHPGIPASAGGMPAGATAYYQESLIRLKSGRQSSDVRINISNFISTSLLHPPTKQRIQVAPADLLKYLLDIGSGGNVVAVALVVGLQPRKEQLVT